MIRLFGASDKTYATNGDKILKPTYAVITKEDNGDYFLDIELGLEYIDFIEANKIIVANTPTGYQAFRITDLTKRKHKIVIKALHVSYDSNNYVIQDSYVVDKNCNDALNYLNNATDTLSPFTVTSDIATIKSYRCVRKSLFEAWQSVLERWGGHIVRNNFNVGIYNSIGQDNGVVVRYGKNEKDITATYNWQNVVTKILPVGKDGTLLPEVYILSSTQYDIPYTKVVSFDQNEINREDYQSDAEYETALINDLRTKATVYLNENSIPQVNYELQANLEKITDVGDTIEVIDERLNINLMTNLISFKYNCILEKYEELQFGNFKKTLSNLLSDIQTATSEALNETSEDIKTDLETKLEAATEQIWGVLGDSYVIYEGDKILIVDSLPKETATNVILINNGGIGFSNTGINGTFSSAWTIDNTLNISNVNLINLTASYINGGTLDLSSGINVNSNKFTVNSNGEINSTGGVIGGYKIGEHELYAETFAPYNFTEADATKVRNYLLNPSANPLTPEEIALYDLDGSGTITAQDLLRIRWYIDYGVTTTNSSKIIMKTGQYPRDSAYVLEDGNGETRLDLNMQTGLTFDGMTFAQQNVLWTGGHTMNSSQSIDLTDTPILKQPHGVVLIWSAFTDNQARDWDFAVQFIPKYYVSANGGNGIAFTMSTGAFEYIGAKYLYVANTSIRGHANNGNTGTRNGVTYNNGHWVLRYVIGV